MNVKASVFQKRPLSKVHSILTSQGFMKMGMGPSVTYRAALRDSSTESLYWLEIPVDHYPKDPQQAKLGKPMLYGRDRIPEPVRMAAESKLHEIADYLRSKMRKKFSNLSQNNGRMAPNEAEVKRLGKEMEAIKTHAELDRIGLIPDPIQYEQKD